MICNPKTYWTKHCQHKRAQNANIIKNSDEKQTKNKYEIGDIHFALMTTKIPNEDFVEEMKTSAIIDTAVTKIAAD